MLVMFTFSLSSMEENFEQIDSYETRKIGNYLLSYYYQDISEEKLIQIISKKFQEIPHNTLKAVYNFIDAFKQLETGKQNLAEQSICPYYPDAMLFNVLPVELKELTHTEYNIGILASKNLFITLPRYVEKAQNLDETLRRRYQIDKKIRQYFDGIEENCILSFKNLLSIAPFLLQIFKTPIAWAIEQTVSTCLKDRHAKLVRKYFEMTTDMLVSAAVLYAFIGILTDSWSPLFLTNPAHLAVFVKNIMLAFLTVFRLFNVKELKSMSFKDSLLQIMLVAGIFLFPILTPCDLAEAFPFKIPMCISFTAQVHQHWVTKNIQVTFRKIKNFFGAFLNIVTDIRHNFLSSPEAFNQQLMNIK